jgi:hypothetical protein
MKSWDEWSRKHDRAYMIAQLPAVELIAGQAAFTTDAPLLNAE